MFFLSFQEFIQYFGKDMQSINEEECILLQTRYITFVHAYHITNNLVDVKKELAYQKEKIING